MWGLHSRTSTPVRAELGHQATKPPMPKGGRQVEGKRVTTQHTQPPPQLGRSEAPVSSAPVPGIPNVWTPTILPRRDGEKPKLLLEAMKIVERFVEQR